MPFEYFFLPWLLSAGAKKKKKESYGIEHKGGQLFEVDFAL